MTVLFADLVGFTALSERLGSEDVREITTECFRRLVAEVVRYEGTVDKFIGDSVMALFGAPIAHEDDPARALWAALAMQRALDAFNDDLERQRGFRLALRIGIETGEVVAGVRDVGGVREYTVIGDAVNVAARLESATEPGTILVGSVTAQRAGRAFTLHPVPPLALKGKAAPVAASLLVGLQGAPSDAVQRAPMVGRAEELRELEACLDDLRRGQGRLAAVVGEPGLGKSRLLAELRERGQDFRWIRGQAFAHEQALSYGLARELLRGLCGLDADEPELAASERLRAQLETLGCRDTYPVLAHLLLLPLEPDDARRVSGLPPPELQRSTFDAVANLLERLAAAGPLVLELDDLHWADPSSIDLLLALIGATERAPVFFCCAFRPERDAPAWALRERAARDLPHRFCEVTLGPLSEAASAELVAALLRLDELPSGLSIVLERAAGTPLWVEELVRTLTERGLLVVEDGRWRVTSDLEHVEIPDSLQALIVARIDRLGDARPTLQTASVIGRRFERRVLERMARPETSLDEHLLRAQRVDLVRELAAIPEREYGFKHALIQEAAYATLLVRRRRELHRQVADALVELYPERLDELHAVLAHHYQRAEIWDKALEHARLAAEAARASYANREALEQYGQALAAAERAGLGPTERLALHEARAAVSEVVGQFEPARADYETALRLAEQVGDATAKARLLGALGMLWGGHKDYQRGLELTWQAVVAAEEASDRRVLAEARVRVGLMLLNLARTAESRVELERALALFRELKDEPGQAQTLDVLSMANLVAGDLGKALAFGREAVHRLQALDDRWTEASSMACIGGALAFGGDRAEAEEWIRRALGMWTEIGARSGEAYGHVCTGFFLEQFGAYDLAFREASAGLRLARELGHREWTAISLSVVGRVRRACGDTAGAQRLHEEMLATARELGTALWISDAQCQLGQDLMDAGEEAAAAAQLAQALVAGGDALEYTAVALLAQAELSLRSGRPSEALDAIRHFHATSSQFRVLAADACRVEGEALAAVGHTEEAEAALRRAKADALALEAEPPRWRACLALGDLLGRTGRGTGAAAEFAEALAALQAVAGSLSDAELGQTFANSEPMRRARAGARSEGL